MDEGKVKSIEAACLESIKGVNGITELLEVVQSATAQVSCVRVCGNWYMLARLSSNCRARSKLCQRSTPFGGFSRTIFRLGSCRELHRSRHPRSRGQKRSGLEKTLLVRWLAGCTVS